MAKIDDVAHWDAKMDALEEKWRVIIKETQNEYKREYLDLYGIMLASDGNVQDSTYMGTAGTSSSGLERPQ